MYTSENAMQDLSFLLMTATREVEWSAYREASWLTTSGFLWRHGSQSLPSVYQLIGS